MFTAEIYAQRRAELCRRVGDGLILLPGNVEAPFNYPNNTYAFRQDSTFLYYFGQNVPSLVGVIDASTGEATLYGDDFTVEDIIWMGPQATIEDLALQVGVAKSKPMAALAADLQIAITLGRRVHYLPPYRGLTKLQLSDLLGIKPEMLHARKSWDLIFAVAEMREKKSAEEIAALEEAFEIGYQMHTAAMLHTKAGRTEHQVAGIVGGKALEYGTGVSFHTILSQHGEVLHNHDHSGILTDGRLLLCDAGGEHVNGYVSDHTRTFPVSGKFTQKQKDIYNIVLKAHDDAAAALRPGMMYMELSDVAQRTLLSGLKDLDLVRGSVEDAMAAGAGYLFMPHGLGHNMGLDVHDMEDLGQIYVGYDDVTRPSTQFGLASLRMGRELKAGHVITNEPGCYFIPALIEKWRAEGINKEFINFDKLKEYYTFGGIRLEDDLLITPDGCRLLGSKRLPITPEEVEENMEC